MTTEPPAGHPEAIVRPDAAGRLFTVERIAPRDSLAEFVDYYWLVCWHVPGRHRQQVVPQPRVHLAAEQGRLLVHGATRKPFFRTLEGSGHVLGAAFHAGGFRPLLRASVGGISGSVRPAAELLGVDDLPVAGRILGTGDGARMVAALEDYLLEVGPEPDPTARQATELVAEAERRVEITRAELLAAHAGMSLRSLQRLFTEYVGIGPKWVIQRFRRRGPTSVRSARDRLPADQVKGPPAERSVAMTQHEHPNVTLVREGFDALQRGDTAWMDRHLADDVVWHVGGNSKWAGAYQGKANVLEFFGRQAQAMGPPSVEVHDILGNDDHVVVLGSASASAPDGSGAEWKFTQVFHLRDGKATEVWGMAENDAAVDPFLDALPG